MGGDSYSLLTEQPGWKPIQKAKLDFKWAGIVGGTVFAFAAINGHYRNIRRDRWDDHDRSIFAIKKSFGTIHPDHEAFHYKTFGKYD